MAAATEKNDSQLKVVETLFCFSFVQAFKRNVGFKLVDSGKNLGTVTKMVTKGFLVERLLGRLDAAGMESNPLGDS